MNYQYPEYQTSQETYSNDWDECGYYGYPSPIQSNPSLTYPIASGVAGPSIYDDVTATCMSDTSYYDNSSYLRYLNEAAYQHLPDSTYCQTPTSESVPCGCHQAYWTPNPQREHFGSQWDYYQNIPQPYTTQHQYNQLGNSTANTSTISTSFRPQCPYPLYSPANNIPTENQANSHISSMRKNQEFNSYTSPTEPLSRNTDPKIKSSNLPLKPMPNPLSPLSHSERYKLEADERNHKDSKKGFEFNCLKRSPDDNPLRSLRTDQTTSMLTQGSSSDTTQTSIAFIDVKARNMAYKLCKLFWSMTQSDWSKLCQKCFSIRNTKFDDFMLNSDILTQYITMLQSINITVQAPDFLRDLDLLHKDEELVSLVETQFDSLLRLFTVVKTDGAFYYYPDTLGNYGPKQDEDEDVIVKNIPLEKTILQEPVNGMYTVLKKIRFIFMPISSETREKLLPKFLEVMSEKLKDAMENLKRYNQLMGERFEVEDDCKSSSHKRKTSILKKNGSKSDNSNRVTFGQVELRDIHVKKNEGEECEDVIIDQVFENPEALRHQRAIRRLLLENCKARGEDVEITPRERYSGKRDIVEKLSFVEEITDNFDNPRTVIRLTPPESPDSESKLPFDNASNKYKQLMAKRKCCKRKRSKGIFCEKFAEIRKRKKRNFVDEWEYFEKLLNLIF